MFLDAGYAEMMKQMFSPFPTLEFTPNYTGYDLDAINWNDTYEAMAPSPDEAVMRVSGTQL